MQEQSGANGAGAAVDMEEARAQRPCAGARRRAGGEQGGRAGSDRFGARAVTSTDDVLIDRGAADRGFAAGRRGSR